MAELQIRHLRNEHSFRELEIAPIYNQLLTECLQFDTKNRTQEQARRTVSTIMCIILTMLMNAVEKGHEEESFDNEPMCMAILDICSEDTFFQNLMNYFFKRNQGYDGKKVVITPYDPMQENTIFKNMDDISKKEIEQTVQTIISHTLGVKSLFKNYWTAWESLWYDICTDTQMILMIKKKEPRGNDWDMNQKMVCNVVGMFKEKTIKTEIPTQTINAALCSKNVRNYLSNHADYDGTNSVFNREQHDKIEQLIHKHILSNGRK
ncbi:MAG: hypothetical protein K2H04_09735 [Bacteroidaceae bacterium]|nr:hypothetical protein [Bacteroidaceae bacterium]